MGGIPRQTGAVSNPPRDENLSLQVRKRVKVKAPFHIALTYEGRWELYAYRMGLAWFSFVWDYWFSMRLQGRY